MTGSTNELYIDLNINVANYERIIESSPQKTYDEGLMETVLYLRGQAKTGEIGAMLEDERLILSHALEFSANSAEEKNSLKSAIAQLDESRRCFKNLLTDPEAYKKNEASFSEKKKQAGLPLDAAREFFQSHSTRLNNLLSGNSPHCAKLLIRQRKDNLQVVKDAYVELQRKALGLQPPKRRKHDHSVGQS